jgi:hypothetical protein
MWGVSDFHVLGLMASQRCFNLQYFVEYIMVPPLQTVFPRGKTRHTPRLNIHLDNCCVHFLKGTEQFSLRISRRMLPTHLKCDAKPRFAAHWHSVLITLPGLIGK